jgi:hypothetical protein
LFPPRRRSRRRGSPRLFRLVRPPLPVPVPPAPTQGRVRIPAGGCRDHARRRPPRTPPTTNKLAATKARSPRRTCRNMHLSQPARSFPYIRENTQVGADGLPGTLRAAECQRAHPVLVQPESTAAPCRPAGAGGGADEVEQPSLDGCVHSNGDRVRSQSQPACLSRRCTPPPARSPAPGAVRSPPPPRPVPRPPGSLPWPPRHRGR